ncbi:DUF1365 domain-containing protein [Porticoccus litoralis]|uniref:DUF1365 domain-containing protein n=1 Tax=Porticoccus litoralis TaxID=434086 RepID=A0AAW8AXI9_9GAMM|nr:DUF1365 domain-containing protein [Porticoccus litoralis]MDP1519726.1 DUF1365 domain-containing protein [Porticoccus litoralis]
MPDSLNSSVYRGHVLHHRWQPRRHRFVYRVFSLLIDLDELPTLQQRLRWLSINRFNLFSFYEKDHGAGTPGLKNHIYQLLKTRGYPEACGKIQLLCYPRILGYVFNPLSVYFCFDKQQQLRVIIYEVTNTFGQRHCYLLSVEASSKDSWVRQQSDKQMYVSPFMPMDSHYRFRILPPDGERLAVCIYQEQSAPNDREAHKLFASFNGTHHPLTNRSLLALFIRYPLMTLKVIGGIHWEALRLWMKGLKLQPGHEHHDTNAISWRDQQGDMHHEKF